LHERAGFVSSDLQAAQERLAGLRRQFSVSCRRRFASDDVQTAVSLPTLHAPIFSLPDHLGWHSQAITNNVSSKTLLHHRIWQHPVPTGKGLAKYHPSISSPSIKETLNLYPDIAMGMLRKELTTTGRIWLLLRFLDGAGRGWVDLDDVRTKLTGKESVLRVCGKRQLRNLLAAGEDVFWERRNGRLWLRSLTKVAVLLDVDRFCSKPVALPVSILTKKIGTVRAHLYASFHSSRNQVNGRSIKPQPIARITLQKITHVHPRIQQRYDKIARVKSRRNFGIGGVATEETKRDAAWKHGQAVFQISDKEGRQGKPRKQFLAWQLPNSYVGPHEMASGNQRKRVNRKLTDLLHQGTVGNDQLSDTDARLLETISGRRYCENGRFAAQAYKKNQSADIYWVSQQTGRSRAYFWHLLSG